MDDKQMIEDFVKMLDSGMAQGVGHVNVNVDEESNKYRQWVVRIAPEPRWHAAYRLWSRGWMTSTKHKYKISRRQQLWQKIQLR